MTYSSSQVMITWCERCNTRAGVYHGNMLITKEHDTDINAYICHTNQNTALSHSTNLYYYQQKLYLSQCVCQEVTWRIICVMVFKPGPSNHKHATEVLQRCTGAFSYEAHNVTVKKVKNKIVCCEETVE
jgi:hypothetical protein